NEAMTKENSRLIRKIEKQDGEIQELKKQINLEQTFKQELTAALASERQRSTALAGEQMHLQTEINELKVVLSELVGDKEGAAKIIKEAQRLAARKSSAKEVRDL